MKSLATPSFQSSANPRLVSLDALRGFDMFWIAGGSTVVTALNAVGENSVGSFLKQQLTHKAWSGFAFYDLIFPLFVFITGVSSVFSLRRIVETQGRLQALKRVLWRGLFLFIIGLFYSGGFSAHWPNIRLLGVLQRIALSYTCGGIALIFLSSRALCISLATLLLGYFALFETIPIRDITLERAVIEEQLAAKGLQDAHQLFDSGVPRVRGTYDPGHNLVNHFDFQWLPGKLYDRYFDPEGILSTIGGVATAICGVLAGIWLRRLDVGEKEKVKGLLAAGAVALAMGWLWHLRFPVIKKLWTSSFVLVAGGYSTWLLAAFYYLVDVRKWQRWCQPFVWVGMNSIAVYFAAQLIRFGVLAERFVIGAGNHASLGGLGTCLWAACTVLLLFGFAHFLYRNRIFLRL